MRGKSWTGDVELLRDETADPVDREAAIKRIGSDQRFDLLATIVQLLCDREPWVRAGAFCVLLVYWHRYEHLPAALKQLDPLEYSSRYEFDRFADMRQALVGDLVAVSLKAEVHRESILVALLRHLGVEDASIVHGASYYGLLEVLGGRRLNERVPGDFSIDRRVDWRRIDDLLSGYSALRPLLQTAKMAVLARRKDTT